MRDKLNQYRDKYHEKMDGFRDWFSGKKAKISEKISSVTSRTSKYKERLSDYFNEFQGKDYVKHQRERNYQSGSEARQAIKSKINFMDVPELVKGLGDVSRVAITSPANQYREEISNHVDNIYSNFGDIFYRALKN